MSALTSQASVAVHLEDLTCEAIIGIDPHERLTAQPLTIDLTLTLDAHDYWASAAHGDLSRSVNYAELRQLCLFLAQEGCFYLLETLTATLARALLLNAERSGVTPRSLSIRASKPEVFEDNSKPSVSLALSPEQLPPLPVTLPPIAWLLRAVEPSAQREVSSAPKRLTHEPATLIALCVAPEVFVAHLTARPHQLSALTLRPNAATLLRSGKWFGVYPDAATTGAPPQALQLGEVVTGTRYSELWCLEGGEAFTLLRSGSGEDQATS